VTAAPPRRNLLAPAPAPAAAGDLARVEDIEQLVRAFYRYAAADELLGPTFVRAGTDWAHHIPRLVTFWSWQLLGEARYDGHPLRAHERAAALTPFTDAHYTRWIELFDETVDAGWSGPIAELAKQRARKMATALRRHLRPASGD
jgi:hemoglobin